MWLTIGLKLLGIGRWLLSAIRAGIKWALSDWRNAVIVALAVAGAYFMLSADKWQGRAERALATVEARDKTIAAMTAASEAAKQAAIANAKRVELEYKEISDNAKITYDRALADNRATVDRWLRKNNRSAANKGDSATATEVSAGIAGAEALPQLSSGFVILPESDLDKIADIQATLYALQQAAREVERVQTSPLE